jgi:PAS domain S-box-containing protein
MNFPRQPFLPQRLLPAAVGIAALSGLYASSLYNFLLFHTLVEVSSVIVGFVIFVLAWNMRRVQENHYLLFLGIASLFTGALELVHALAYKGFGVFPGHDADLPTQLWIAFRYVFSISFLIAPLFITRKLNVVRMLVVYTAATALLFWSIFAGVFPRCFVEGRGLTPFKVASEYVIIGIFLAALALLLKQRNAFDRGVLRLLVLSIVSSIVSELAFTQYASVFGFTNIVGHFFLLISVYFIYRAIVVTGIVNPSSLLFRNLKLNEDALRQSETKYRALFENMIDGFAFHQIVANEEGKPIDYVFLEINSAFERLTGLKRSDIIGKKVTEAMPGIERDPANWIGVYGDVALSGRDVRFEQRAEGLNKWYSVSAYSPLKGYFVAVFEDITERKQAEAETRKHVEELQAANAELARFNRAAVGRETRMVELKKEVNECLSAAGQSPRYPLDFEEQQK